MVGLNTFADASGSIEQVMNLWLSEARSGTPDLYALLDKAEEQLSAWVSEINLNAPVTIEPMHTFPVIRDLVTDVSWNFRAKKTIKKFNPRPPDAPDGTWRIQQADVERVQEFRKCIECFLCQDVCHVLREHHKHDEFIGPRLLVYAAALEMHPLDTEDRVEDLRHRHSRDFAD